MTEERRLAAWLAEVSSGLMSEKSEDLTFDAVVRRAVDVVPGCEAASITLLRRRGRFETVAASDQRTEELDAAQYALDEGPCLDAAFEAGLVVVPSVATETRWPAWAQATAARGLGSSVALRLRDQRETLGALNLYSSKTGAFDAEAVDIALIFTAHATDAMSKARLVTGLEAALESRHLIGIAQGVLAARYDITYERAFDVLHRFSNDRNIKLRDVAAMVADARGLPTDELDPT